MINYKIICILIFFVNFYNMTYGSNNILMVLIYIELCFLSINLLLIINSWYYNDIHSQIFIIYILTLTAIETALGLALFILYYKMFKTVDVNDFKKIKL